MIDKFIKKFRLLEKMQYNFPKEMGEYPKLLERVDEITRGAIEAERFTHYINQWLKSSGHSHQEINHQEIEIKFETDYDYQCGVVSVVIRSGTERPNEITAYLLDLKNKVYCGTRVKDRALLDSNGDIGLRLMAIGFRSGNFSATVEDNFRTVPDKYSQLYCGLWEAISKQRMRDGLCEMFKAVVENAYSNLSCERSDKIRNGRITVEKVQPAAGPRDSMPINYAVLCRTKRGKLIPLAGINIVEGYYRDINGEEEISAYLKENGEALCGLGLSGNMPAITISQIEVFMKRFK